MKNNHSYENYDIEQPLCAFSLSPPFFIRILSREKRCLAPSRRLDFPLSTSSYSRARLGRYFRKKSSCCLQQTVPGLFNRFKKRKHLKLDEILSIVQSAWKEQTTSCRDIEREMESSPKKIIPKETFFPVLQRRRLSVPETIMRKHLLAQEKLNSQESKSYHWGSELEYSSDPNLNRKKDSNLMRKSTLLRRLWGNSSKSKLSGSFQEWQHSSRKLSSTQSLNSTHSSPEHLPKNKWEFSPRRKPNTSFMKFSSKHSNDEEPLPVSPKRKSALSKVSKESTVKYTGSSFVTYTDSAHSDSAYTNSISNLSGTSSTTRKVGEDENCNPLDANSRLSASSLQESGVQTKDVTNLNVISNVNLSQATLDVIFKEVMKDINAFSPGSISINSATVTRDDKSETIVQEVPSFFLNTNSQPPKISSEKARIEKFIISNVRSGSSYGKPSESSPPAVPRFSAIPRTSSMEVNTSELDKEESDTGSFADSLEDFNSPRGLVKSRRNSTDITQLLPEGRKSITPKKSSTFYIPIEVDKKEVRAVSELLPDRVREKLNERQQKREEKLRQLRSSFKAADSISEIKSALNFQSYKPKKRIKPILPSIESLKNSSKESRKDSSNKKRDSKAIKSNLVHSGLYEQNKKPDWSPEPRKIYERTPPEDSGKKIEILEIVECSLHEKNQKSKIPVPVSQTVATSKKLNKPVYLDFDNVPDPKFDQLIANILIDTLNHDLESPLRESDQRNANITKTNREHPKSITVTPEEVTTRSRVTSEGHNNNNVNINNNINVNGSKDEKETKLQGRLIGKKSMSSIPKGWVTFYNMHKDMGTPESTSDEGKKSLELNEDRKEVNMLRHNVERLRQSIRSNVPKHLTTTESNDISLYSSGDEQRAQEMFNGQFKKFGSYHRRRDSKLKYSEHEDKSSGKWSVTISGSNSYGQTAPDVEMRLKFPHIHKHKHSGNRHYSDSGLGEENLQDRNIPNMRQLEALERRFRKRDSINENLPKIQTARSRKKKREYSMLSMVPSSMVPRQTKTSTSRYHLSRPRERYSLPDVPSMLNERQYCEILKRIPDILAVTGQSISPERRSIEDR
ncbi:hypothetical protein GWI33_001396 [Rhynchophorus ferrugineus]|uniref:Uncharacterized protein n=1 Tax=Rhynchophorus ferrugineus TaxID=354439 RepID=A0A834IZY5_RHYFE|nr:hypothetical protein GWI33_001396 [Rhynchophorus ferrugineus]